MCRGLLVALLVAMVAPGAVGQVTGLFLFGGDGSTSSLVGSQTGTTAIQYGLDALSDSIRGIGVDPSTGNMVAVGAAPVRILYSTGGAPFQGISAQTAQNIFSNIGRRVRFFPGVGWVAVGTGNQNTFATSPDGITWTGRNDNHLTTTAYDVAGNATLLCAVGEGTQTAALSTDLAVTWQSAGRPFSRSGRGVAFAPELNLFVAVGDSDGGTVRSSSDCVSWTTRSDLWQRSQGASGRAVAWGGTGVGFVAVGDRGNTANTILASMDGITWTPRGASILQDTGTDVAYGNGLWAATGTGGGNFLAISRDNGVTWESQLVKAGFDNAYAVAYYSGTFQQQPTGNGAASLSVAASSLALLVVVLAALIM